MSVVVPFPGARLGRAGARGRSSQVAGPTAAHPIRGGGVISWVRAAECACCGRPTLAGQAGLGSTLCAQCRPPSVA
ncbi:MAG TPA: hypothetical protein VFA49_03940 [Chloroflexota bacterium]|jgi:hypothetical protein|nr:hypothetical protein [Chloroflexota bacterium]